MRNDLTSLKVCVKGNNRIKVIGLYRICDEACKKVFPKYYFNIQFLICDPSEYKDCKVVDLFNDVIMYILSPLTVLQSSNVIWSHLSISVFGNEVKTPFYQRLPIKVYGLHKSLSSSTDDTSFSIRVQYYNSSQTSTVRIHGVSSVIKTLRFQKKSKNPLYPKIRDVEKLFLRPVHLRKAGLVVRYVKSIPKKSKEVETKMPLYVTAF